MPTRPPTRCAEPGEQPTAPAEDPTPFGYSVSSDTQLGDQDDDVEAASR